ncbi:MAG: hypothetical protein NT007_06205 [Candidatus Kapabacteria bacterium]|nr:hypothetical protein [Candidatus Kapabacteria bacterium]
MKAKLFYTLLLLSAINLQSPAPIMKIYLADGSSKQYNLTENDSLSILNKAEKSQMQIFYFQTKAAYYPHYLDVHYDVEGLSIRCIKDK